MPRIDLATVPARTGSGYPAPFDVPCAGFPKGSGHGHHLKNASAAVAVYLEVGSRQPNDLTTCSDIDLMSSNTDGRFVHQDGTPYPPR